MYSQACQNKFKVSLLRTVNCKNKLHEDQIISLVFFCVHAGAHTHTHTHIHTYTHIYIYICVYMCVCVYIYEINSY